MASIQDIAMYDTVLANKLNEKIAQKIEDFQTQSGLIIDGRTDGGSFISQDFVSFIGSLKNRAIGSTAAVASTSYKISDAVGVKVGRYDSIVIPQAVLNWKGGDVTDEVALAIITVATQLADALIQDQINTAVRMFIGATNGSADANYNEAAPAVLDIHAVNNIKAQFGDRASTLKTTIMHSGAYNQLLTLANEKNVVLYEGQAGGAYIASSITLGGNVIVSDCPELSFNDGVDKFYIVTLVDGGIKVSKAKETIDSIKDLTKVNTTTQTKFDADYFVQLLGYAWDNSKVSPTDAELSTYANYTRLAASVKGTAGVMGTFLVTAA